MSDPCARSTAQLLAEWTAIMRVLRARGVLRTGNNPVGDLAEFLAEQAFRLKREENSTKSFDARCEAQLRWQIKARRLTSAKADTSLGVIRNLEAAGFDVLLAVYFDENFGVLAAYRIARAAVGRHAYHSAQNGGRVLRLTPGLLADVQCVDVSAELRAAAASLHVVPPA